MKPFQDHGADYTDEAGKIKHSNDNPFIEPVHGQTVVDMKGKCLAKRKKKEITFLDPCDFVLKQAFSHLTRCTF